MAMAMAAVVVVVVAMQIATRSRMLVAAMFVLLKTTPRERPFMLYCVQYSAVLIRNAT